MARSNKWVAAACLDEPVTKVARRALRERLSTVWRFAHLAAMKSDKDIEHVHQLRVATRRAKAALQIYSDLLPKRKTKQINKTLRELRRAAGEARDLDVLGERLRNLVKGDESLRLRLVIQSVARKRRKAQKPLLAAYKRAKRNGFKKRSRALTKAVRWRGRQDEPTYAEVGRMWLPPMVAEFFQLARADLSDIEQLHLLRISGKQVRYGIELLAGAFDQSFRQDLYPAFAEVQDKLGVINDHATAIKMFSEWRRRAKDHKSKSELSRMIDAEEGQLDTICPEFRDWWSAQRCNELEQRFAGELQSAPSNAPVKAEARDVTTAAAASEEFTAGG